MKNDYVPEWEKDSEKNGWGPLPRSSDAVAADLARINARLEMLNRTAALALALNPRR